MKALKIISLSFTVLILLAFSSNLYAQHEHGTQNEPDAEHDEQDE